MEAYDDAPIASKRTTERTGVPLWVTLLLLAVVVAVIAWRQYSVVSAERRFEADRQELTSRLNAEKASAVARTRQALIQHNEDAWRLFGTALGWTVRDAMMRDNRDQIDQYFTQLVKDARVRLVLLADPNGKVIVSSDRNFQGVAFSQHFPPGLLQGKDAVIVAADASTRRLVVPVHGLSAQLGTVVIDFETPADPTT